MQCQLGRGRSRLFRLPALLGARRALPGLTELSCKIRYLHTSNPADQIQRLTTSIEYVSRAGKLRALAVTTMSRAALLQRPSMQSPKSDQALTALCAGCSQLARRLSDPAPACMGECAYVTKPEQPRNLRYM